MEVFLGGLSNINWLAVLVSTIAAFIFGWLWYSPFLFGKPWMKIMGFTEEQLKKAGGMGMLMALAFVANFVMASTIAYITPFFMGQIAPAVVIALVLGLFIHAPAVGTSYLFERKPLKLWIINITHDTAVYTIMAIITVLWNNAPKLPF